MSSLEAKFPNNHEVSSASSWQLADQGLSGTWRYKGLKEENPRPGSSSGRDSPFWTQELQRGPQAQPRAPRAPQLQPGIRTLPSEDETRPWPQALSTLVDSDLNKTGWRG